MCRGRDIPVWIGLWLSAAIRNIYLPPCTRDQKNYHFRDPSSAIYGLSCISYPALSKCLDFPPPFAIMSCCDASLWCPPWMRYFGDSGKKMGPSCAALSCRADPRTSLPTVRSRFVERTIYGCIIVAIKIPSMHRICKPLRSIVYNCVVQPTLSLTVATVTGRSQDCNNLVVGGISPFRQSCSPVGSNLAGRPEPT